MIHVYIQADVITNIYYLLMPVSDFRNQFSFNAFSCFVINSRKSEV